MQIAPNPAREALFLSISAHARYHDLRLEILDAAGRITGSKTEADGALKAKFDLKNLPQGRYFLRAVFDGSAATVVPFEVF